MNISDLNAISGLLKIWTAATAASRDFVSSSTVTEYVRRMRGFFAMRFDRKLEKATSKAARK